MPYIVKPNLIVKYESLNHKGSKSFSQQQQFETIQSKANYCTSDISDGARSRMIRALQILFFITPERTVYCSISKKQKKFYLGFVTLTIPVSNVSVSDSDSVKYLLAPFIRKLRHRFGLINYVWKAETTKAGTIHFHLIIDTYIHFKILRDIWNVQLNSLQLLDSYKTKHGHINANSTDVKHVSSAGGAGAYISKYVSKSSKKTRLLSCKNWDCCEQIKRFKYTSIEEIEPYKSEIDYICQTYSVKSFEDRFFSVFIFGLQGLQSLLPPNTYKIFTSQFQGLVSHSIFDDKQKCINILEHIRTAQYFNLTN